MADDVDPVPAAGPLSLDVGVVRQLALLCLRQLLLPDLALGLDDLLLLHLLDDRLTERRDKDVSS